MSIVGSTYLLDGEPVVVTARVRDMVTVEYRDGRTRRVSRSLLALPTSTTNITPVECGLCGREIPPGQGEMTVPETLGTEPITVHRDRTICRRPISQDMP